MRLLLSLSLSLLYLPPVPVLSAQDTTQSGVRIGITYTPGTRPSLAVLGPGPSDSLQAILQRDLDQSDRFEVGARPQVTGTPDASTMASLGVAYGVFLSTQVGGQVTVTVMDARAGAEVMRGNIRVTPLSRPSVHVLSDQIIRAITGQPGIAGTSLLFVRGGRVMRVDADGANAEQLRTAGFPSLSPAWHPDGRRFAYMAYVRSGQPIVVQDQSGTRTVVPGTEEGLNITPAFSPDGRRLAFAHGTEAGMDIYLSEGWGQGPGTGGPVRLTAGRGSENLSPVWSPDGTRIAFISTRARSPQLYVMGADGTGQEVLARFDFGATGTTSAPSWSPDGGLIAFHREVGGTPQVFVFDVAARSVRQLTGSSRNEDPSWAPDGRHLVFVSSRTGTRELWVLDLETGRLRQLTRVGGARLPAWSPKGATAARE